MTSPADRSRSRSVSRRSFLRNSLRGAGVLSMAFVGSQFGGLKRARANNGGADTFGPLQPPDANGLQLPPGFTSRIVAKANERPVLSSLYNWPELPDGGATFARPDGGWVYAANSEVSSLGGGVGALRFASDGTLVDAYPILTGTSKNCAGGPTPWGTWLSCEELDEGQVWECDPMAPWSQGIVKPALGIFKHEAAAVDPIHRTIYLTEDQDDGRFYRFTPSVYPNLTTGTLEVMEILDPLMQGPIQPGQTRSVTWHVLPNPTPFEGGEDDDEHFPVSERSTRYQVLASTAFDGGEGCWYEGGKVYWTTKGDNRVWVLDTAAQTIEIVYDFATTTDPDLSGVDNIYASPIGDVYVAEDGGNMELVALTPTGDVKPVVHIVNQPDSEIAGPALSPDGLRMYFSSQKGPSTGGEVGITYEVTGPWMPSVSVPLVGGVGGAVLGATLGALAALRMRRSDED